jgi:hypothetical protein
MRFLEAALSSYALARRGRKPDHGPIRMDCHAERHATASLCCIFPIRFGTGINFSNEWNDSRSRRNSFGDLQTRPRDAAKRMLWLAREPRWCDHARFSGDERGARCRRFLRDRAGRAISVDARDSRRGIEIRGRLSFASKRFERAFGARRRSSLLSRCRTFHCLTAHRSVGLCSTTWRARVFHSSGKS